MKLLTIASALIVLSATGQAVASCAGPDTRKSPGEIQTILSGNTACVGTGPNWDSQEFHSGGATGSVIDWKKGPSDPEDPTENVGSYKITGTDATDALIEYTYPNPTNTYQYSVWAITGVPNNYSFCGVNGTFTVVVKPAQGAC